jgi:uncharacterized protein (DUF2267 family)
MDDLIKQVSERTGLSEEKAKTAVDTVVNFLKDKLPSPIAGQIDNALSGAGSTIASTGGAVMDKAGDMLGGIFGKKE